jgi:nitroreductase
MMNETMKTILNRRTIRTYKPDQITDGELETILEAGKYAASGMGMQPWHFTVVQNKEILNKVNAMGKAEMLKSDIPMFRERAAAPGFSPFYNAPTLVIVSGDKSARFYAEACALAIGNMFLAATSLGVGSVWSSLIAMLLDGPDGPALAGELKIPEGYRAVGAVGLGYNAGEHPAAAPRKEGTVTILK